MAFSPDIQKIYEETYEVLNDVELKEAYIEYYCIISKRGQNPKKNLERDPNQICFNVIKSEMNRKGLELPDEKEINDYRENEERKKKEQEDEEEKLLKMTDTEKDLYHLRKNISECSDSELLESYRLLCKQYKQTMEKYGEIDRTRKKNLILKEALKIVTEDFSRRNLAIPDYGIDNIKSKNLQNKLMPLYDLLLSDVSSLTDDRLVSTYKNNSLNLTSDHNQTTFTFWDFLQPILFKELVKRNITISQ